MSLFIDSVLMSYFVALILLQNTAHSFFIGEDSSTKCYGELGCFSSGPPFKGPTRPFSSVPSSPDHIKTLFILYTRENPKHAQELDARKISDAKTTWTHFKNRPTKLIVHGFLDDINLVSWMRDMKTELLHRGDYNAIIVDWHHGNLPPYTQATANTRVVGAQMALLIKQLQGDFGIDAGQVHIIGHSLGAHIAGYAGERIQGLGRITGLDPAGPYFFGTDKVVRLDPTDASLVDTIHSDAEMLIKLGFGMHQAIGHMDFFPNLGHDQPGCERDPINLLSVLVKYGIEDSVACNHLRSIKFFIESINTKCPFTSFPCSSEDKFKNNKCQSCGKEGCAAMGYNAYKSQPSNGKHVKYFTTTSNEAPFCQYHMDVKIKLSSTSRAEDERGTIKIRLRGDNGISTWLNLYPDPIVYYPGKTYETVVGTPGDIGTLKSVEFQWHHISSLTNPFKWNPFGLRHPKIFLHSIVLVQEEYGRVDSFCAGNAAIENNESLLMIKRCK